jgi:hypothetical protein
LKGITIRIDNHPTPCANLIPYNRDVVLAIESLVPPTFSANGCDVVAGLWNDPYTK